MTARPPSRGKLLDANTARPPSRSFADGASGSGRPSSSPRVMLQPLQPPNSQGFAGGSSTAADDKEYLSQLKREIRLLASKVSEYSAAVETDRRMADSSSLLRRPLTPGSANRPATAGGQVSAGQIAANIDTFIEKASAGKGAEQAKSALLELLLTVLEDAQRCTLMLTEKRAPAGCTVPAPSSASGRMGSRVPVTEALMERTLQLHGAVRPEEDVIRTRPLTGGPKPPAAPGDSGLSVDLVTGLLMRLADLYEHYGAIADGQRDVGGTEGGKLLGELDAALAALTATCSPAGHSKLSDAAARVQGEARNANLTISTALAMSSGGAGAEEELSAQLRQARTELADARKEEEATKAKLSGEVAGLQSNLKEKSAEVEALQRQLQDATRSAERMKEEDASAAAQDLMAVAKATALEASNAELSNEVKQLKAQLEQAKRAAAPASGVPPQHAADASRPGTAAARPGTSAVMGRPGTAAALSHDELRQEWLTLRGELGVARSQLASTRQDKIQLETRLRSEKEKGDDLAKVCEEKDEQIAHLRSELRSLERLNNASGNADTFEAVLAEEMHTMRESFEQKIASLKAQMERDTAAFSRERKEMRESYDKDAKAMKRQIELLQVRVGDYSQPEPSSESSTQVMSLDD